MSDAGPARDEVAAFGTSLEVIRRALITALVVHLDETGFRVAGTLAWVHSASAGRYALITVHPKRGREAMDAARVLSAFRGTAVHDCWSPYDTCQDLAGHALCNAHARRELQAVIDTAPDGQWCWGAQAADAQREMKRLTAAKHGIGMLDALTRAASGAAWVPGTA